MCQARSCEGIELKEPSAVKTIAKAVPNTIGLDIAKNFFQVHAVDAAGQIVLRRKLGRGEVRRFFEAQPKVLVGIEACGTGHYWAREIAALGHEVRLLPPTYVKPYVKRGKTDVADAEAICEAVTRPNMHFVPVKTPEQQAALMMHRSRELLVGQRTALVNAFEATSPSWASLPPRASIVLPVFWRSWSGRMTGRYRRWLGIAALPCGPDRGGRDAD